ncbi:tol-pal system YbgF family protein [Olleya sp. ITB9]|uniref:tetratricopeptide repeat protein n=1 Tax=Olleya sp. ITB9 TaxID=1715648 RepID=UPI0006D0AE58|nr:hypothetical protein [Olleya sp. ITB9]
MDKEQLLYLYFSNTLTPEQEQMFSNLLKTDSEFKAQFDFENNIKQVIKAEQSEILKSKLQGFENNRSAVQHSNKSWFNWRIAASIVFFIAAGWFGYDAFFGVNYNDLYTTNYKNYPNTVYTITRGEDTSSLERDAFVAYETEDYTLAIQKFNEVQHQQPYFNFYKAQSYLGLDELEKAKDLFLHETTINESQFKAEANWYLALINLKQQNKTEATKYLETLIANYNYKKKEAKTLLDSLD